MAPRRPPQPGPRKLSAPNPHPPSAPVSPPAPAPEPAAPRPAGAAPLVVIRCARPLGGIIRTFPFAAHLAKQGKQVLIECPADVKSILNLVDYAGWKDPALPLRHADGTGIYDELFNLQIFPGQVHRYRTENPPKRYGEFLESMHPETFKGMRRDIVLSKLPPLAPILEKYRLPADFDLACPVGSIEDEAPVYFGLFESWLSGTVKFRNGKCYILAAKGWRPNRLHVSVDDLAELATLIRHAQNFASINAAPAVLASALFEGKRLRSEWHHVSPTPPRVRFQDDILCKEQVRWEVNLGQLCPSIVRQKK